jgi:hypothetical protein
MPWQTEFRPAPASSAATRGDPGRQAVGYQLEEIHDVVPELIARAGEGDVNAKAKYDERRLAEARKPGGGAHRPSMGQDKKGDLRPDKRHILKLRLN